MNKGVGTHCLENNKKGIPTLSSALRLLLTFAVLQLFLHLWQVISSFDSRLFLPHGIAFIHDLLLLELGILCYSMICRFSPDRLRVTGKNIVLSGIFALGLLLASYPRLLREYLAFPVNLFAADGNSARVVLVEYLGFGALWPVLIAGVLGTVALIAPFHLSIPRRAIKISFLLIILASIVTLPRSSPQPFIYSLQQEINTLLHAQARRVPSLKRPKSGSEGMKSRLPALPTAKKDLKAEHIILIVLEGVTGQDFEQEFMTKKDGFFSRVKDHAAYFRQYYTTNLDSHPSLIAMLTSVQVPYRAYADESLYRAVNYAPNLTRAFKTAGFSTLFISTYEHQPFVPTVDEWERVMDRRDLPTLAGWLSLGSNRMEAATEDRAALPAIMEFMTAGQRSFVLHELVFGHSPEWRSRTGQTQLSYYDTYLNDLLDRLKAKQMDSRALLVIVSDHGDRAKADSAENYRVPLMIVGNGVVPGTDDKFRSHLDLQQIIRSYVTDSKLPPERSKIFVVGSSERWVYGEIAKAGGYTILDDTTGRVLSQRGTTTAPEVYRDFQSALDEFGIRFGQ